jgi:PhoH-like ATPase
MNDYEHAVQRLFILDTNVLMHDPAALFRFQEHDIYLPMVVLEELDAAKQGTSEVARNVRQVSRLLDDLVGQADHDSIEQGIELPGFNGAQPGAEPLPNRGRLRFQTRPHPVNLPTTLPGNKPDNSILGTAIALRKTHPDKDVVLVSKDINLRIKAHVLGICAEDYSSDKVLDDVNLLYTGTSALDRGAWEHHAQDIECWQRNGRTFYAVDNLPGVRYPNQCTYLDGDSPLELILRDPESSPAKETSKAVFELARDYRSQRNTVWGINARNREQNFALNLLMDPEVDFVTLLGTAGTGKTLLTLAAGLTQTLEEKRYREIVMTRATVSVGEDIGFLPGTEEEKMTPWMGALMDNLEVLTQSELSGDWARAATNELIQSRIKIRSLSFMRGRTFLNRFVIVDEAQNLTPKQAKTLITRAGPGTKIVCLGNVAQIDTPYLSETTSGLTYVVDRFKDWRHSGHITLTRGERSRLADHAARTL